MFLNKTIKAYINLFLLTCFFLCNSLFGQTQPQKEKQRSREVGSYVSEIKEKAKQLGIKDEELDGYVTYIKRKNNSGKKTHQHKPIKYSESVNETVIYIEPGKPMSIGCPNMGYEQYNFSNWTGGTGSVSIGAPGGNPNYNILTNTITNPAGDNVSVINADNFHTIMTVAPINPIYPSCTGYDSLACRVIGTQTISEVPFVSPYSFDPVSVRLNSANAGYTASRLKYITTSSSVNKRVSFSFAVVFHNPISSPHLPEEAPYFNVVVKNENTGQLLPGCSSDSFNPKLATASDSIKNSVISDFYPIQYRKWTLYTVDLSSLTPGTPVSISFEVGGCTQGGHWGYAYVDAECGGIGSTYGNMCSGSNVATLVAPLGFTSYQWFDPNHNPIPGANNDTLIVNPGIVGQQYSVNLISPAGCSITQSVTIGFTSVNIININSTNSCAGGNSGTAFVQANGSSGIYTYTWTSTSGATTGSVVGNAQTATGLAPGSYSVAVSASGCGQASANLSIGVAPPYFVSINKSFCGNQTLLQMPGGTNYKWYKGSGVTATVIPAPSGSNDSLFVNNPKAGDIYTLVYKSAAGCNDSIQYILNEINSGSAYITKVEDVCATNSNGVISFSLNPSSPSPYSLVCSGLNSNTVITSSIPSFTVSNLSAGNYSISIIDGDCVYNKNVSVNEINTPFTASVSNTIICSPLDTNLITLTYPNNSCVSDPYLCFNDNQKTLFVSGPYTQNGLSSYPTPFGNYYTYGRSQYLVRKSDLNTAGVTEGKISSLSFNLLNLNGSRTYYPNFSIKIGCSTLTALPDASTTSQNFITGTQTVYSNINQPISSGWLTFDFDQAYLWDNNSNLIIEVCFGMNNDFDFTENVSVELKQMPYVANFYHVEDIDPVCGGTQLADNGDGLPMTNGKFMLPNMKFGFCPKISKSDYTVSVSSNGQITNNYSNDSIKIVSTNPNLSQGSTIIYSVSVISPNQSCPTTNTVMLFYPAPTITITTSTNSQTVCVTHSAVVTASGPQMFNWFELNGSTLTPISNSYSIIVTPTTVGQHSFVVTGSSDCTTATDTKTVVIDAIPKAILSIGGLGDKYKCLNSDYVISSTVNSSNPSLSAPYTYTWTSLPGNNPAPGTNNLSSYTLTSNTTSSLVLNVNGFCSIPVQDTIVIKNFTNDISVLIADSAFGCSNTLLSLSAMPEGGRDHYTFNWYLAPDPNSIGNTQNLSFTSPEAQGIYTVSVVVTDSCNYVATDSQEITVLPPCNVSTPNVITPNGDGVNDYFIIANMEHHPNSVLTIFDRWGRKVYENSNYNNTWKADGLPDGTYFYILDVPEDKKYNGFLTVFREK